MSLLPAILEAPSAPEPAPTAELMRGDVAHFAMEPLFVRGVSDRF